MQRALASNDPIFVAGRAGKLYVGESAGAIVAAPDIAYSSAMDSPDKAPDLHDRTGLGLVGFYPVPHANNRELGPAAERIVREHADVLDLRPFDDKQAIYVENGTVRLLNA